METSMVRYEEDPSGAAFFEVLQERSLTPFSRFAKRLLDRYGRRQRSADGKTIWHEEPIEAMLHAALMLAAMKLGQRLAPDGKSPRTANEFVAEIAPRATRLINNGLVLRFPKGCDEAARQFHDRYVVPALVTVADASEGTPLLALWGPRLADFFLDCMRASKELEDRLREQLKILRQRNRLSDVLQVCDLNIVHEYLFDYLSFELSSSGAARVEATWRNNLSRNSNGWFEQLHQKLSEFPNELERYAVVQAALLALPVRANECRGDVFDVCPSVEYQWLRTQLLLAAANAPDREYLLASEGMEAFAKLPRCTDNALIKRFFKRMRARGYEREASDRATLEPILRSLLVALRNLSKGSRKVTIDELGRLNLFVLLSADDLVRAVEEVNWAGLSAAEFKRRVKDDPLADPLDLAEGLLKMEDDEQQKALAFFLRSEHGDHPAALKCLYEAKKLPFGAAFVLDHAQGLPHEYLCDYLHWLATTQNPSAWETATNDLEESLLAVLGRVSDAACARFFEEVTHRKFLASWLVQFEGHALVSRKFWRGLPQELLTRLVLLVEIRVREQVYPPQGDGLDDADVIHSWEEIVEHGSVMDLPSVLKIRSEELSDLPARYLEDEMFLWAHAGEKHLKARLATFRANRERYFSKKESSSKKTRAASSTSKAARPKKPARRT